MSEAKPISDETRRVALLEAAARILAEEGAAALSTRRLASEVGASTMAVYTWFGSKPNLMRALFVEGFRRFEARLRASIGSGEPLADLIQGSRAYRDHALAEPNLYDVMFGQPSLYFEVEPEDLVLATGTFDLLVEGIDRCVRAGLIDCDALLGARQMWSAFHGEVTLELTMPAAVRHGSDRSTFDALLRTLWLGLGGEAAPFDEAVAHLDGAGARRRRPAGRA